MQVTSLGTLGLAHQQSVSTSALRKTSQALTQILERLSTGQRINRASDDAAGLGVSEQMRTQIRGFKMADRNVSDAMSALNIGEGAAGQTTEILQRQRELALQSRNDTLSGEQRTALNVEYQQLNEELTRLAEVTQFNSQPVANGQGLASGNAQIQVGANEADQLALPSVNYSAVALGVGATSIDTGGGALNALDAVDSALNMVNMGRSTSGAMVNRFQSISNNLRIAESNTQAAESVLRDQDMAKGITDLLQQQLLNEGGTRAFSRFNQISANHLLGLLQ